ncbi:MAG: hypothetical protein QXT13_09230 [Pyrobaculum sp.]|jgi:hypothetical protein
MNTASYLQQPILDNYGRVKIAVAEIEEIPTYEMQSLCINIFCKIT